MNSSYSSLVDSPCPYNFLGIHDPPLDSIAIFLSPDYYSSASVDELTPTAGN